MNLSFLFIQNILYGHKDVNKRFTLPLLSLSLSLSIYDSLREREERGDESFVYIFVPI